MASPCSSQAGAFFERLDDTHRAMEAYRKGQAYARAVDLSRRAFQVMMTHRQLIN